MPRANRYIVGGNVYHLTHRCHDRKFLLKFARDRDGYRRRLYEAVVALDVSLLDYNITSNHVHLVAYAEQSQQLGRFMQQVAGEAARDYNRRKKRSGAFWEGRYHATMVDSGQYLWQCLKYVELNMVRCRAVSHPSQWEWSGYGELMGLRRRNRLLDIDKLLWLLGGTASLEELRLHLNDGLEESMARDQLRRESKWTESLAVGSRTFIEKLEERIRNRQKTQTSEEGGTWVLQECYESIYRLENRSIPTYANLKHI